ncbi:MAG: hypothetical protein A3I07_03775 [Candidatus Doudnabacteria bacterium RIFCSPLOWO2_02_FULL_42_9]|uniref:Uncharacterized protein n=1 Tax=Candidatus Doudnabacteria bacterium RIFCSPHIGHO2_01_FULL_41_86 TaxID=1817821 RepID=A0A1F5N8U0_9BACT|nr:MAG: hypothetical protein A2717_00535 [Candidatus Doudnabacteria bacterium RIFCSPHIGHO2_01_FULL_41_86]OGE75146.1 MAG: hypothetical protein A3K07_01515 [Candidatus Doudnabacteria bacterium RIFCSPHIGHO2_01_43_10]OGE86429.1 MAG: hypothetical protein A3E28_00410 [Candidatus Doudnabacteria bacterium RIFCSPHIGHO2_12_FULL_42_22]OGE87428.1 MAG: hypothetical protein A3C49_04395 [Candidatus Doudnabacteria bacterium RIFCSPHIGHO2_02_FULL_42_25]OGE92726.1 MAG: hypothetical protein A2895_03890 [Candidatus
MINYLILAQTANTICNNTVDKLCNPVKVATLPLFISKILIAAGAVVGVLTIIMVVYSGTRMILSQGNEEDVTKAKSSLQWSISGFVLTLFAYIIVYAVSGFFQTRPFGANPGQIENPLQSPDIFSLIQTVLTSFLGVVGLLAILFIIINGFRYITSRGNEEQSGQAKQGLTWSVLGLIVSLLAYVIVAATANFFK